VAEQAAGPLPSAGVTGLQIRPFETQDLAAAGSLLAARHARHRRAEPLLSARYEDADVARAEVQELVAAGATGAVALDGDVVTGFLLGLAKPGPLWGANVWVEAAGQAVTEAETVRDLYAAAAAGWAGEGRDAHYVLVPAHDAGLVDAWFRLCFGLQHVHAVRDVPGSPPAPPRAVTVRPATRGDIPVLAELDLALPAHQGMSPVFSAGQVASLDEAVADWEESFDDEGFAYLVAEHAGRVIGSAVGCPLEKSSSYTGPTRPDRAGFLGFAAVLPEARGLGAGRALGEAVLEWCRVEGFSSVVTDWRSTNLLSSRTWPRLGFRPTFLRLHRRLGY
jgi:GNAT superfamily N-acetyltransferase